MSNTVTFHQRDSFIYVVAACCSVLISAWISINASVINPDAICYVLSAQDMMRSGFVAGMHLCPQAKWPFYSLLVNVFAQLTTLSFITSAYVLDAVFSAISVVMFIAIIKELGGGRRVLWLATLVILCAHQFNSVRHYIVRDHGYWAFYLISIWCLLRYVQTFTIRSALNWFASLLIATLFRIEGLIFLCALPFIVWFLKDQTLRQRARSFFIFYTPLIMMAGLVAIWLLASATQLQDRLVRVYEVTTQIQYGFVLLANRFDVVKLGLNTYALPPEAVRDTGMVLVLVFVTWYLLTVINNLSWIYTLLVGYAWSTRAANLARQAWLVLFGYLLVNLAVTAIFFGENLYLAKRYLIGCSLVLMCWVPFALERLYKRSRIVFSVVIVVMIISTAGVFVAVKDPKAYVYEGGLWLSRNVPQNALVFANTQQLRFYSNHYQPGEVFQNIEINNLAQGKWQKYDYLALVVDQEDAKLRVFLHEIPYAPIQTFANARGDKVVIYKVQHEEKVQ